MDQDSQEELRLRARAGKNTETKEIFLLSLLLILTIDPCFLRANVTQLSQFPLSCTINAIISINYVISYNH